MRSPRSLALICFSTFIVAGCATAQSLTPPEAPSALQPPADQSLYVEALATGVQIYECSQKTDTTYEWTFKAPEASLVSRSGQALGKHYAGPTWESTDGSTVVGELKAKDPGPTASAIPWLLLTAKTHTGSGTFAAAKSVQRLVTVGGLSPSAPCTGSTLGQVARIPYSATYYFYR
ncbi:MAG: hypothetical protein JWR16_2306 [Nevskia sp.]|nr:hypothetical protein [Nevskia sp.]